MIWARILRMLEGTFGMTRPKLRLFQYYGNREKLRSIGREGDLEKLNRDALRMAREVADETGTLMAGNLCYSGIYSTNDEDSHKAAMEMFIVILFFLFLKIYMQVPVFALTWEMLTQYAFTHAPGL